MNNTGSDCGIDDAASSNRSRFSSLGQESQVLSLFTRLRIAVRTPPGTNNVCKKVINFPRFFFAFRERRWNKYARVGQTAGLAGARGEGETGTVFVELYQ